MANISRDIRESLNEIVAHLAPQIADLSKCLSDKEVRNHVAQHIIKVGLWAGDQAQVSVGDMIETCDLVRRFAGDREASRYWEPKESKEMAERHAVGISGGSPR